MEEEVAMGWGSGESEKNLAGRKAASRKETGQSWQCSNCGGQPWKRLEGCGRGVRLADKRPVG